MPDNKTPALSALYYEGLISDKVMRSSTLWKATEEHLHDLNIFPPGGSNVYQPLAPADIIKEQEAKPVANPQKNGLSGSSAVNQPNTAAGA